MFVISSDRFAQRLGMAEHLASCFSLDGLYDLVDVFTVPPDSISESCMLFFCPLFERPFLFDTLFVQNSSNFPVELVVALLFQLTLQLVARHYTLVAGLPLVHRRQGILLK